MEALSAENDFVGPLIDDSFPDPERCGELKDRLVGPASPRVGSRRLFYLSGAIGLWTCGVLLIGFASLQLLKQAPAPIPQSFRPLSERSDLPWDLGLWTSNDFLTEYHAFTRRYGRNPGGSFEAFEANLRFIGNYNTQPHQRARLAPNRFADLTMDQWAEQYLKAQPDSPPRERLTERRTLWSLTNVANASLPIEVNWVDRGCVTPVKDQSHCGSCWAFSSTGAMEGALCAQTGVLLSLSEQELVDCSAPEGTHGCNGGFMDNAFRYVLDNGGLCSEADYPYTAKEAECRPCKKAASIDAIYDVPPRNVKAMKAALAMHGPVAAAVQADQSAFQFYHDGILDLDCGKKLNHAILVVGYGATVNPATAQNETYWLVKNSWGSHWGDQGYIRLGLKHHGKAGECGVLLAPTLPIVSSKDILDRALSL